MVESLKVLVACSDPESRESLFSLMSACGLEPVSSSTLQEARAILGRRGDDIAEYIEAMQLGAFDFIARPYRRSEMQWIVSHAVGKMVVGA